ncbi:hypothetical protein [Flavobacteriaceae bacterium 14752]|uniref:hypothetical protein n=1 Tax=Mesohalobacter salilacus TaxID=2491711 RepID=UPI000F638C86|nr:hypothetical protein EIG84_12060 [Flavobacteriaceae bacterium 14752]
MEIQLAKLYLILCILFSINLLAQKGECVKTYKLNEQDSLVSFEKTRGDYLVKIYDSKLVKKKDSIEKNSLFLPQGFYEYYSLKVIKIDTLNNNDPILSKRTLNLNNLVSEFYGKLESSYKILLKKNDNSNYILLTKPIINE